MAQQRRLSWLNEDDLRGRQRRLWRQTKTTFANPEDDLPLQPSASDALRLPTHKVGLGSGLHPEAAPSSTTLPDQRDRVARPLTKA